MSAHPVTSTCDPPGPDKPLAEWTDLELLELIRSGGPTGFAELYRRYAHDAVRFARSLVRPEDVDDVVSESFAKVLHAIRRGNGPEDHPVRYLMVAVRSTAVTVHVQRARRRELTQRIGPGAKVHEIHPGPRDDRLAEAFHSLSPRWRRVIWWSEIEGLSSREVGDRLGLSPNAAAALRYRARNALRTAYLDTSDEGPISAPLRRGA